MSEKIIGKIKTPLKIQGNLKMAQKIEGKLRYGSYAVGDDYNLLKNKPQIEGIELQANKTFEDLGLVEVSNIELKEMFDKIFN